jgi:hypothetical protein
MTVTRGFWYAARRRSRAFAQAWPDWEICSQAVSKLPWGHNLELAHALPESDSELVRDASECYLPARMRPKTPLSTPPDCCTLGARSPQLLRRLGARPGFGRASAFKWVATAGGEHEATCLVLLSVTRDLPLVLMSDLPEYGLVLMRLSVFLGYNMA